jgi:hypothetical protein
MNMGKAVRDIFIIRSFHILRARNVTLKVRNSEELTFFFPSALCEPDKIHGPHLKIQA